MNIITSSFDITSSDNLWLIPSFDELTDPFGAEQVGILDVIEEVNPSSSVERNAIFQTEVPMVNRNTEEIEEEEEEEEEKEREEMVVVPSVKTEEEEIKIEQSILTNTTTGTISSANLFTNFNFQPFIDANNNNNNNNMVVNQNNFSFSVPLPKLETTPAEIFDEGSFGPHKKIKLGEFGLPTSTTSTSFPSVCLSRKELLEFSSEEHEQLIKKIRSSRQLTEEEEIIYREQRRLIKNREAASHSRARKKTQIETLSEEVTILKAERETLEKEIERRTVENLWMKNEVQFLFTLVQQSKSLSAAFELFQKKPIETSSSETTTISTTTNTTISRKRKHAEEDQIEGSSASPSEEAPIEVRKERLAVPNINLKTFELGTPFKKKKKKKKIPYF